MDSDTVDDTEQLDSTESNDESDGETEKGLYEYESYEALLEEEVMQDPIIAGPEELSLKAKMFKVCLYFLFGLVVLISFGLVGYVFFEMILYLVEYVGDNIEYLFIYRQLV
jgi:hypothetical protein